jgi:hypothetical protein
MSSLQWWHLHLQTHAASRRSREERHRQTHHLLSKSKRLSALNGAFTKMSLRCRIYKGAAGMCWRVHRSKTWALLRWCISAWDTALVHSAARKLRSEMQTTIDELHKSLETSRKHLADTALSARRFEYDLEIRTSELDTERQEKSIIEAKNQKRYLSRQHLTTRLVRRDLWRRLCFWHEHVNLIKGALVKSVQRAFVHRSKHLSGVFQIWRCSAGKRRVLKMRCRCYCGRVAHQRLGTLMHLWQMLTQHFVRLTRITTHSSRSLAQQGNCHLLALAFFVLQGLGVTLRQRRCKDTRTVHRRHLVNMMRALHVWHCTAKQVRCRCLWCSRCLVRCLWC